MTASSAISNSDLNACSFLTMYDRLEHFAKQIRSSTRSDFYENIIKIQSLACSLDQFKVNTEA